MKKIRLEIPLEWWDGWSNSSIWLKCDNDHTEAFKDKELTIPYQSTSRGMVLYVKVPDELSLIEVVNYESLNPISYIANEWSRKQLYFDWKIPGIKKVTIIAENLKRNIPIADERPNLRSLEILCSTIDDVHNKTWGMEVYTFENATTAIFHWKLALKERCNEKVKEVYLSLRNKIPCIWEDGEFRGRKAEATVVCNEKGEPKKAIYVRPTQKSALVPLERKDVIVKIFYDEKKNYFQTTLSQVEYIYSKYSEVEVSTVVRYSEFMSHLIDRRNLEEYISCPENELWSSNKNAKLYKEAILAAVKKMYMI